MANLRRQSGWALLHDGVGPACQLSTDTAARLYYNGGQAHRIRMSMHQCSSNPRAHFSRLSLGRQDYGLRGAIATN